MAVLDFKKSSVLRPNGVQSEQLSTGARSVALRSYVLATESEIVFSHQKAQLVKPFFFQTVGLRLGGGGSGEAGASCEAPAPTEFDEIILDAPSLQG